MERNISRVSDYLSCLSDSPFVSHGQSINVSFRSGVLCTAHSISEAGRAYVKSSSENIISQGIPSKLFDSSEALRAFLPESLQDSSAADKNGILASVKAGIDSLMGAVSLSTTTTREPRIAAFEDRTGYLNPHSGWAESGRAVEVAIERFKSLGGTVRAGVEIIGLIEEDIETESQTAGEQKEVKGVKLANGEEVRGDLVVIAAGAWTPALFEQHGMGGLGGVTATG